MFQEYLKHFGLTRQEAAVYSILLKYAPMTGYEAAKESGISRSNVYTALNGLVEKGAAYLQEGSPARYVPTDVERFCRNTMRELQRQADYLCRHAPERVIDRGGYLTVRGSRNIRDTIREMLEQCDKRLYILAEAKVIAEFEAELKRLIGEQKKVVLLTKGIELEGTILYETEPEEGQIRFITDSACVLTGELRDRETDSCLYSRQGNLVQVMKEALRNRITLIQLGQYGNDQTS